MVTYKVSHNTIISVIHYSNINLTTRITFYHFLSLVIVSQPFTSIDRYKIYLMLLVKLNSNEPFFYEKPLLGLWGQNNSTRVGQFALDEAHLGSLFSIPSGLLINTWNDSWAQKQE